MYRLKIYTKSKDENKNKLVLITNIDVSIRIQTGKSETKTILGSFVSKIESTMGRVRNERTPCFLDIL